MANLLQALSRSVVVDGVRQYTLQDYYDALGGLNFSSLFGQTLRAEHEQIENNFPGYVTGALKSSGPIFAAIRIRMALFSEARIMWRNLNDGRPGDLAYTPDLDKFRRPWPGGTTGDLLARSLQDADLAGNSYTTIRDGRFKRMRPDWTTIVLGIDGTAGDDIDPDSLDAEVVGYIYQPGGRHGRSAPVMLDASQVAHFAPMPDPLAHYRGMSWLTPVIREIQADKAATLHKLKFFENGATPNLAITLDADIDPDDAKQWLEDFREFYGGAANAYKTLALAGGANVEVVGANFQQLDFKVTQGYGETRIFEAAGIHPVVAGSSEGLQGASLNAGNYGQASRNVADITLRPLWRSWCGSFETLVPPPQGRELWYDDRDIAFLTEDQKDAAEVLAKKATAIRNLTDGGYTAESVVDAVANDDLTLLDHSGLLPVQQQPPGENNDTDTD